MDAFAFFPFCVFIVCQQPITCVQTFKKNEYVSFKNLLFSKISLVFQKSVIQIPFVQ